MKTRCKFRCLSVTDFGEHTFESVEFSAIADSAIPEDQNFAKYTPSGNLKISVNNPALRGFYKAGKNYFIEISSCEEINAMEIEKFKKEHGIN